MPGVDGPPGPPGRKGNPVSSINKILLCLPMSFFIRVLLVK